MPRGRRKRVSGEKAKQERKHVKREAVKAEKAQAAKVSNEPRVASKAVHELAAKPIKKAKEKHKGDVLIKVLRSMRIVDKNKGFIRYFNRGQYYKITQEFLNQYVIASGFQEGRDFVIK